MSSAAAPAPAIDRRRAMMAQVIAGLLLFSKYIQIGGAPLFAVQLALSAAPFLVAPRLPKQMLVKAWPILALPLWAVLSTGWSEDRPDTLRYSAQFLLAICGAVGVGLTVKPQNFVRVVYCATLLFLLACIASGIQGRTITGPVLIGLTGSKNQISIDAQILFISALALLFDGGQSRWLRLSTLGALPIAAALLWQSHSATGLLAAVGGGATVVILQLTRILSPQMRLFAVGGAFLSGLVLAPPLTGEAVGVWDTLLKTVFQKDRTLTGRTYLWTIADDSIRQHPLLGQGWKAFWAGGGSAAEGALHYFGLTDARGFGFQDTYRSIAVDLGIIGLGILLLLFAWSLFSLARRTLLAPTSSTSFLLATILTMAAISLTDFTIEPGLAYTVLLFAAFTYALADPTLRAGPGRLFSLARPRRASAVPSRTPRSVAPARLS